MILGMNTKFYKETRQRELILAILKGTHAHPTADGIYEEARKKIPRISKGTVYRNLAILSKIGEIVELNLDGTNTRYEVKQSSHYHFRCEQCGKVEDVNIPFSEELNDKASDATGYMVTSHQLEFRGLCKECQMAKKDVRGS
jgi:Fur family transcriptional regulator, peroxide stress response regulator